jgi:hypothetical protein
VVERSSARRQEHAVAARRRSRNGFERLNDGRDLHHHAMTAPVRRVVGGAVTIVRVLAQVDERYLEQAGVAGALRDADRERRREELWKDRDDVNAHGSGVEQPWNRVDDDAVTVEVDRLHDVGDQWNQVFRGPS